MKKNTFKYKNKIPKSLSGKKKTKTNKKENTFAFTKNTSLLLKKKGKHLIKGSSSKWKLPTFLFSCLLIIVLIIPTVIVLPFIGEKKETYSQVEAEQVASIEESVSPFSVHVYRSTIDEIEEIPLEDYVVGVVASEMPIKFETEALKAQALAARTYIVNHMMNNQGTEEEYDVTDTVQHQVYQSNEDLKKAWGSDYAANIEKLRTAVKATEGEVITSKKEPITPAFFSTSNGYTENSEDYWGEEMPYLRSVESAWDENSPEFLDQKVLSVREAEQALGVQLPVGEHLDMEVSRTDSNRVSTLSLENNDFSGREVRERLNLKSSDFSIKQNNDHLVFTTKGYGHGIGMSQYGANGMAKEGKTYEDIVEYYYKDITINKIDEVAETLVSK